MRLTTTQQMIYDGLQRDPAEFGDATEGLDVAALGAYVWLACVVAHVAARFMTTRWPLTVAANVRSEARQRAQMALVAHYAPGRQWHT